jgi:hypothetical protein
MSSFNTYGNYYLAREVRTKLGQFRYQNDFAGGTVESFKDLKEQILSGPVTVHVMGTNRFKVLLKLSHYHEALCKRHYFGVRRMHRLCRSAERLAVTKWATAWTLTTCYYAAYFAALELLHVIGRHVSYFSPDEIDELNARALPAKETVTAGVFLGIAAYDATGEDVEITYTQSGQKPHDFAWHQLRELVQQTGAETADAVRHRETLLRLLGTGGHAWDRPNEVRNKWNYVDPTLFCERGETLGAGMNQRILSPKDAHRWGIAKHLAYSEQNEATGLAYLRATLVEAVDRVAEAVLPEKLARQRAN